MWDDKFSFEAVELFTSGNSQVNYKKTKIMPESFYQEVVSGTIRVFQNFNFTPRKQAKDNTKKEKPLPNPTQSQVKGLKKIINTQFQSQLLSTFEQNQDSPQDNEYQKQNEVSPMTQSQKEKFDNLFNDMEDTPKENVFEQKAFGEEPEVNKLNASQVV